MLRSGFSAIALSLCMGGCSAFGSHREIYVTRDTTTVVTRDATRDVVVSRTVIPGNSVVFAPHLLRLSDGRTVAAEMATMRVPERRGGKGRAVDVALIKLASTSRVERAPIVFLPGSPGGASGTQTLRIASLFPFVDALRSVADVIVMDYRGSGLSSPPMDCPPLAYTADAFATRDGALRLYSESAAACARRLRDDGADLAGYTWSEVAEDVAELRERLRVRRVSLVGFSSGTHLAFAVLRRHERDIERVVLIGSEGPDDVFKLPSMVERQVDLIGALLRSDSVAGQRIPDFPGLVRSVLATLDTQPAVVPVPLADGSGTAQARIGGFALAYITAKNLAGPEEFTLLPPLYATLARGDLSVLTRVIQRAMRRPAPNALTYLLDGSSGASPERTSRILTEARMALLGDAANFPFPEIQRAWGYTVLGDNFRKPLRSRVPALFVTGTLDGNTPVDQAESIRAGFPNGRRLWIENGGHGSAFTEPAVWPIVIDFLRGRNVRDTVVIAAPPRFPMP